MRVIGLLISLICAILFLLFGIGTSWGINALSLPSAFQAISAIWWVLFILSLISMLIFIISMKNASRRKIEYSKNDINGKELKQYSIRTHKKQAPIDEHYEDDDDGYRRSRKKQAPIDEHYEDDDDGYRRSHNRQDLKRPARKENRRKARRSNLKDDNYPKRRRKRK